MKKITLPIVGMHCTSCAQRIEEMLKNLNGVSGANVSFAAKKGTARFDAAVTSEAEIRNAIEQLGYTVGNK